MDQFLAILDAERQFAHHPLGRALQIENTIRGTVGDGTVTREAFSQLMHRIALLEGPPNSPGYNAKAEELHSSYALATKGK